MGIEKYGQFFLFTLYWDNWWPAFTTFYENQITIWNPTHLPSWDIKKQAFKIPKNTTQSKTKKVIQTFSLKKKLTVKVVDTQAMFALLPVRPEERSTNIHIKSVPRSPWCLPSLCSAPLTHNYTCQSFGPKWFEPLEKWCRSSNVLKGVERCVFIKLKTNRRRRRCACIDLVPFWIKQRQAGARKPTHEEIGRASCRERV